MSEAEHDQAAATAQLEREAADTEQNVPASSQDSLPTYTNPEGGGGQEQVIMGPAPMYISSDATAVADEETSVAQAISLAHDVVLLAQKGTHAELIRKRLTALISEVKASSAGRPST